jgi:hypothetical protein
MKAIFAIMLLGALAFAMSNGAPRLACSQCHTDAKGIPPQDIVFKGLIEKNGKYYYVPCKTYKLEVKILDINKCTPAMAHCGGFAVAASAGQFKIIDPKDTMIAQAFDFTTGKIIKFVTHTAEGSLKKDRTWVFEWKAPCKPEPVQFKISALVANGDGAPTGDWFGMKIVTAYPLTQAPSTTTTTTAAAQGAQNVITITVTHWVTVTVTKWVTVTVSG